MSEERASKQGFVNQLTKKQAEK